MNVRFSLWLLVLASLLNAGCRVSPSVRAHIDETNARSRMLEDQVYDLEYQLQTANDTIARLEGKTPDKKRGPGLLNPPADRKSPSLPDTAPSKSKLDLPELPPPSIDSGSRGSSSGNKVPDKIPDFDEPQIDLGEPTKKPPVLPPATVPKPRANPQASRFETPSFAPPRNAAPSPEVPLTVTDVIESPRKRNILDVDPPGNSTSPVSTGGNDQITQLYLNPFLTASSDFDNKAGDDGLTVVIEPRNATGDFVPVAGAVSLALLDPSKEGDAARIARWNFSATEANRFLKKQGDGAGLHLKVTWPGARPDNSRLRLFVRYETPDHQFLQADHEIFVTMPDQLSNRWTPKTRRATESIASPSPAPIASPAAAPPAAPATAPPTDVLPQPVPVVDLSPPPSSPALLEVPEPPATERPPTAFSPGVQTATQPRPTWKPQR